MAVLTPEMRREVEEIVRESLLSEGLRELTRAVRELAEAQERTEERVSQLAEAQRRTEGRIDRLEATVQKLAEAQARTERRLEELAEAQARTEEQVRTLTREMALLAEDQRMLRRTVAGLSDTVGYTLENQAMKSLPELLRRDYGLEVEGRLVRRYVRYPDGKHDEVNIYGWARRDGKRVLVVGEAKTRPSKREVERFRKLVDRVKEAEGADEVLPIIAVHTVVPELEEYIREKGIALYWSYEL